MFDIDVVNSRASTNDKLNGGHGIDHLCGNLGRANHQNGRLDLGKSSSELVLLERGVISDKEAFFGELVHGSFAEYVSYEHFHQNNNNKTEPHGISPYLKARSR